MHRATPATRLTLTHGRIVSALLLWCCAVANGQAALGPYTLEALQPPPGTDPSVEVRLFDINVNGDAVGYMNLGFQMPVGQRFVPLFWPGDSAVAQLLPKPAGVDGTAYRISDTGHIVGSWTTPGTTSNDGFTTPVVWEAGEPAATPLGVPTPGTWWGSSSRPAINNHAAVVETLNLRENNESEPHGFYWSSPDAEPNELFVSPRNPGWLITADLNDAGVVVGNVGDRPVTWDDADAFPQFLPLPAYTGPQSGVTPSGEAIRINDHGVIVGTALTASGGSLGEVGPTQRAARWDDPAADPVFLDQLPRAADSNRFYGSEPRDFNDTGFAVGTEQYYAATYRGVVWDHDGQAHDISDLVFDDYEPFALYSPRTINNVIAISEAGHLLATAVEYSNGSTNPEVKQYRLTPTLLPGDYNASGQVEQGDLDLVLQNWGVDTDAAGVPAGWVRDLPHGQIEQTELDGVLGHWGSAATPDFRNSSLPEPASAVLQGAAGLVLLRRRGTLRVIR